MADKFGRLQCRTRIRLCQPVSLPVAIRVSKPLTAEIAPRTVDGGETRENESARGPSGQHQKDTRSPAPTTGSHRAGVVDGDAAQPTDGGQDSRAPHRGRGRQRSETGESTLEGGKPPRLFSLNAEGGHLIGIHYSGNHFFGSLVDLQLRVMTSVAQPVPAEIRASELVDLLDQMVRGLLVSSDVTGGRCPRHRDRHARCHRPRLGEVVFSRTIPASASTSPCGTSWRSVSSTSHPSSSTIRSGFARSPSKRWPPPGVRDGAVIYCDDGLISGLLLTGRSGGAPTVWPARSDT